MGKSLPARFRQYQRERFPLVVYTPLVAALTFASAAYSRMLRGEPGFLRGELFAVGVATALTAFLWLRILDEHKDAAGDARYRPELPVPRGLISQAELRGVGLSLGGICLLGNGVLAPRLLLLLAGFAALTFLSNREFFTGEWLRARPLATMLTHMVLMPALDGYTTGLDWLAEGGRLHSGLFPFLALTYVNGCVLELGRKMRAPEQEREGVVTYSQAWGISGAVWAWRVALVTAGILLVTCLLVLNASLGSVGLLWTAGGAGATLAALLLPAAAYRRSPTPGAAAQMEQVSALWVLLSYLFVGTVPFLGRSLHWW